jgi:hypothetical protein
MGLLIPVWDGRIGRHFYVGRNVRCLHVYFDLLDVVLCGILNVEKLRFYISNLESSTRLVGDAYNTVLI